MNKNTKVLALKYRPQTFDDLIGQEVVAETIINKFDIDYVWSTLKNKQKDVCEEYVFTPSDSVWLATTNNPAYDKFKRGDVNRLCLAPCY